MTLAMFDAAWLPSPAPTGFDVAAGYVYGRGAAHIWPATDWARAAEHVSRLLPIATCWPPFGDAVADAHAAIDAWLTVLVQLGRPLMPCAFALDVEAGIAPAAAGYVQRWRAAMRAAGYYDVAYTSRATLGYVAPGPAWIAFGTLVGDTVIVQTGQEAGGRIDTDTAADTVPFYPLDAAPLPVPHEGAEVWLFVDEVNAGLDAAHPRCCTVQADGSIVLGNGARLAGAPAPVKFGTVTVIASEMPRGAGWKMMGAAMMRDPAGRCIGFRYEALAPDGQWHAYVYRFGA